MNCFHLILQMELLPKYRLLFIVLLAISILTGCSTEPDPRLERIDRLSENDPCLARVALDSVDRETLAAPDRHFHDLLDIKIDDKNYVRHTTDSLILDVLDYYSSHKDSPRYPEALYYAGRVYSDLGDGKTALKYFQPAVDILSENGDNPPLLGNAIAQVGNLLSRLGLYDQAVPYVSKSIVLDSVSCDTLNWIRDKRLLGSIYLYSKEYDNALLSFNSVLLLANAFDVNEMRIIKVYLAACHYEKDEIGSAVKEIRNIPETIDSLSQNFALAYAAKIYLKAEKLDSAFLYSRQLVNSNSSNNKIIGYSVLLSPKLRQFIPSDSIYSYFNGYKDALDDFHNRHQAESAITQNSLYNYELHDKERMKTEDENNSLKICIYVLLSLLLISVSFYFYKKYRNNKKLLRLHESLEKARLLKESPTDLTGFKEPMGNTEEELRLKLQHELIEIFDRNENDIKTSSPIMESYVYSKITELLKKGKGIPDSSELWQELESEIENNCSGFKRKLEILTSGKLKEKSYRLAMLIKAGFKPMETTVLMNKTKGTISHYRKGLVVSMFGDKDTEDLDILIRLI